MRRIKKVTSFIVAIAMIFTNVNVSFAGGERNNTAAQIQMNDTSSPGGTLDIQGFKKDMHVDEDDNSDIDWILDMEAEYTAADGKKYVSKENIDAYDFDEEFYQELMDAGYDGVLEYKVEYQGEFYDAYEFFEGVVSNGNYTAKIAFGGTDENYDWNTVVESEEFSLEINYSDEEDIDEDANIRFVTNYPVVGGWVVVDLGDKNFSLENLVSVVDKDENTYDYVLSNDDNFDINVAGKYYLKYTSVDPKTAKVIDYYVDINVVGDEEEEGEIIYHSYKCYDYNEEFASSNRISETLSQIKNNFYSVGDEVYRVDRKNVTLVSKGNLTDTSGEGTYGLIYEIDNPKSGKLSTVNVSLTVIDKEEIYTESMIMYKSESGYTILGNQKLSDMQDDEENVIKYSVGKGDTSFFLCNPDNLNVIVCEGIYENDIFPYWGVDAYDFDINEVGKQTVTIQCSNPYSGTCEKVAKYTIEVNVVDNDDVTIDGEEESDVIKDSSFELLAGMTATTALGKAVDVSVADDGGFDISKLGVYTVKYEAVHPVTKEKYYFTRTINVKNLVESDQTLVLGFSQSENSPIKSEADYVLGKEGQDKVILRVSYNGGTSSIGRNVSIHIPYGYYVDTIPSIPGTSAMSLR